ncbi:MAG: diguanylate cyclase [Desulfuromonadales bacterium]
MDRTVVEKAAERFGILDHAPIGQFILKGEFTVLFWNRCLEAWTGISRDHIVGTSILDPFPHLGSPRYKSRILSIFQGGPPTIFSSQLHKHVIPAPLPEGKFRHQYTVVTGIPSLEGNDYYAMFAIQDVTSLIEAIENNREAHKKVMEEMEERRKAQADLLRYAEELQRLNGLLEEQAIRDGLTDLHNHRYFCQNLRRDFLLAKRHGSDIACILVDLDHFKAINDTYGHLCGDLVLREVASLIRGQARKTDLVCRYGGEEVALLLPQTNLEGAGKTAENIRTAIGKHLFSDGNRTIRLTASLGIASLQAHAPSLPQDLLAFADKALYLAKGIGRNQVREYSREMPDEDFMSPSALP